MWPPWVGEKPEASRAEAALCFLDKACQRDVPLPRIVDVVRNFLTRFQREPWLRFDPELAV